MSKLASKDTSLHLSIPFCTPLYTDGYIKHSSPRKKSVVEKLGMMNYLIFIISLNIEYWNGKTLIRDTRTVWFRSTQMDKKEITCVWSHFSFLLSINHLDMDLNNTSMIGRNIMQQECRWWNCGMRTVVKSERALLSCWLSKW